MFVRVCVFDMTGPRSLIRQAAVGAILQDSVRHDTMDSSSVGYFWLR